MEVLSSSYLYAIQKIDGETREEKFKEIGRIVNRVICNTQEESECANICAQYVPDALVPLIKTLVGIKIKSYTFILEALKSDNTYLITEALRARWFFDGSNKFITNYRYYSTEILPYTSMSTRRKIVKKLSICLSNKPEMAEDFFNGFIGAYEIHEATPFLQVCGSEFIYEALVKHKIFLSNKGLKILYQKYPEIALRYLKFTNPNEITNGLDRLMYRAIEINEYESFIPLLVTKHPEMFVKMHQACSSSTSLGNRRCKILLKNAKEILIQRPRDIIRLMPIKLIYDNLKKEEFERMFGNIFEDRWEMFNIDDMLNFLEYYPETERVNLIRKKVKEKYNFDLFEKVEKLTPRFLLLLSKEERFKLARQIIEIRHKVDSLEPEISWWCYLPVEEAIPALKLQICKFWKPSRRKKFFSQMIYVCKLNNDKESLLEVLRYVDEKYKNERSEVICNMLDRVTQEFDITTFDENYWKVLFNLIQRIKLKKEKENARDYWVLIKILKRNVHYNATHGLPVKEIIDVIVRLFLEGRVGVSWKLLEDDAEYERKYLDVCFKDDYWLNMNYNKNVVEGICSFNERHVASNNSIQRLSVKDYPHLLKIVEETLKKLQNTEYSWIAYTKEKLKKHEPDLYNAWFPEANFEEMEVSEVTYSPSSIDDKPAPVVVKEKVIYITEAIIALKRNYSEIKNNWARYYDCCLNEIKTKRRRRVKQFLKSLRWYQDVPIKFAQRCVQEKNLNIMGFMLDGMTFSRLLKEVLEKSTDGKMGQLYFLDAAAAVKNTSTPIPIDLVKDFLQNYFMYCHKNYINYGLKMWSYVSYHVSSNKMIALMNHLANDRLFMKRNAIRLMSQMAAGKDIAEFYLKIWKTEEHMMIRKMLVEKTGLLFTRRPSTETWDLMHSVIADLTMKEDDMLIDLIGNKAIPVEFAAPYAEQLLKKLKCLVQQGMTKYDAIKNLDQFLHNIKPECTDRLSEEFYMDILTYYLTITDLDFSCGYRFAVKVYLNPSSVHYEQRLEHMKQLLIMESKRWYNLSIEKRKPFNFIDSIVQVIVCQVQKFKGNLKLVEDLLEIFGITFTPHQHAWAYIMLFLCVEYLRADSSFRDFGLQLSANISLLLERYSPLYFMQIVEYIREFIWNFSCYDYSVAIKKKLYFLDGLIESRNRNGPIIAAKLLSQKIVTDYDNNFQCKILKKLSEINDPLVQSFL